MTVVLVLVAVIAVAALALAAKAALAADDAHRQPLADGLMTDRLKERFVVTAVSGEAFSGLLIDVDERTVVLRDVSVLKADGARLPVDGELVLRRDAIAYMQRP